MQFLFFDRINWMNRISPYRAKKYPVNPVNPVWLNEVSNERFPH
jgi:hypothetical protein